MDIKVYKKEEVKQPSGTEYIVTPNIIDLYPVFDDNNNILLGAEEVIEKEEVTEQECALATIWQKGQDPLDLDVGIRWSEAILEEINVVQLMDDITNAVSSVTPSVTVVFDTVTDANGNSYLKYTIKEVA